jgi:cytochrome c-type biogenesis protein CcmH/NrfF
MILLLWSLPVTAVALGLVWLKRGRGRVGNNGEAQQ